MEERALREHNFNGGESFRRERIYVAVNRESESKSKRGVWIQE
jgi:hypothetical protein